MMTTPSSHLALLSAVRRPQESRSFARSLATLVCILFAAVVNASAANQALPLETLVADFNHDGIPDLLVTSSSSFTATIAFGSVPYGTFAGNSTAVTFPAACTGVSSGSVSNGNIVAADFNGDGFPDLYFTCVTDTSGASITGIMLGKGDGTFAPPVSLNAPYANSGAAADFNRDGKIDLVLVSYPNGFYFGTNNQHPAFLFFAGNGDGTFAAPVTSALGTSATFEPGQFFFSSPIVADADGDGYPDIVLNSAYGYTQGNPNGATLSISIFGNRRDGTFGAISQATRLPDATAAVGTYPATSQDLKVIPGNFFGDAVPALAVPALGVNPGIYLVRNTSSSGVFSLASAVLSTYAGLQNVAAGNFTGSGFTDLLVSNGTSINALINDGSGNFGGSGANPVVFNGLSLATSNTLFSAADANGDGYSDIYTASNSGNSLALAVNLLSGTATATSQPFTLPVGTTELTASWPGNLNYSSSSAGGSQTVVPAPTSVTLGSSLNPSPRGTPVTFTALVASLTPAGQIPTGTLAFLDGSNLLGNATLDRTGLATITTSALAAGTHAIQAAYSGDAFFAASNAPAFQQGVIQPGQLTANLLLNPGAELGSLQFWTPGGPGTPIVDSGTFDNGIFPHTGNFDFLGHDSETSSLSQTVSLLSQGITAAMLDSGTLRADLNFWEQGLNQGTPSDDASITLTFLNADGATISSFNTGELDSHDDSWTNYENIYPVPAGARSATYTMNFVRHAGSDLDAFVDDNSLILLPAAAAAPTPLITWTPPNAIPFGTPLSATQLNATVLDPNGIAIPGAFTYTPSAGTILPVGVNTLSVLFTPNDLAAYSIATATVPLTVLPAPVTTTLAIAAGATPAVTIPQGSVVTLTATVLGGITPVNPGQVNFCDAAFPLCADIHLIGTAQLNTAGTATFRFIPAAGSHTYKAVFLGNANYSAASSSTSPLAVTALYPTATSLTQSGTAGNYTLAATVIGTGGIASPSGQVSFTDTTAPGTLLGTADLGPAVTALSFTAPSNLRTGTTPIGVTPYDLNGDGRKDLVVNNSSTNTLSILLGNGDGTFTPAPALTTGGYPASLAIGDFNGDGFPDIAVTNFFDSNVTIFLGHGDGTFTAGASQDTGTDTRTIVTADFNRDGKLDLAIGHDNSLTILLGNGDGTFTPTQTNPSTGNGPNYGIAAGDFNGDGLPDIAVTNAYENTLSILLGNGDGTFAAKPSPATGGTPVSLAVGDLNGDGKLDIAVADQGDNNVTILLGNGDGTFSLLVQPAVGLNPQGVSIGDLDGDGKPDLAVANENGNTLTILRGNGDGTFTLAASPATGASPDRAAIADFDGDGLPDLASSNVSAGGISILLTRITHTATATAANISPVGNGIHQAVATFPGNASFTASSSSPVSLIATPAASVTTLVSSLNPASTGSVITFTATVAHTFPQVPVGTVTFTDGTNFLGTSALSAFGVATFATSTLGASTHSISAVYSGDTTFAGSRSTVLTQVVQAVQGLTLSPGSLAFGNQTVGTQSAPQLITVSNLNTLTINIVDILLTLGPSPTDYSQANNCPAALLPGASCTLSIRFTPHGVGSKTAGIQIDDDSTPSTQSVNFTGTGTGGILQVDPGNLRTIAGTGAAAYTGDGGPATAATLNLPAGVAVDPAGNIYIADELNSVVRKVSSTGVISTFAGTGISGYTGDGGLATAAQLKRPTVVLLDAAGNVYITDAAANVVRKVSQAGIISTFAGTGTAGRSGDGGPAVGARLNQPQGAHFDRQGNLYIALCGSSSVRKIDPSGIITTVAGNFTPGFSGDGGPATSAQLYCPSGVDIDASGNFYIADDLNHRIRKVDTRGIITTIAGDGSAAFNGDGIPAASAQLNLPNDLALDSAGNLYIADSGNNRIRRIATNGTISTVAGGLQNAGSAAVNTPLSLAFDSTGNLFFVDSANNAVREFFPAGTTPFRATAVATSAAPQTLTLSNIGNAPFTIPSPQSFTLSGNATDFFLTGGTCLAPNTTLAPAAACTLQVTFTPTAIGARTLTVAIVDSALNSPQSFTLSGTGTQGTPIIAWTPTVPTIPNGTPLGPQQLNATATNAAGAALPGTFTYTPATGTILPLGSQTLSVVFTPTDAIDYTSASASTIIQVTPVVATLTAITPNTARLADPDKTISLTGTGFVPGVIAQANGVRLVTTFVNATTLTAVVPSANFAAVATLQIAVLTPATSAATASLPLTVTAPTPAVTLSGPSTSAPGTQPALALTLANAYPVPLTATFTLAFTSAVTPAVDDPSIQFAGGGRTFSFTVPANSTNIPAIQLQAGTVAGTITVPLTLTAAGTNVTPATIQPLTIVVPGTVPAVSTATLTRSGTQLTVTIHGFSNTREVAQAAFHFLPATGAQIDTPDVTIPVTSIFAGWFSSAPSVQYGSTFTYTQIFTVSDTNTDSIGSVQVTLTNAVGVSTVYTAQ